MPNPIVEFWSDESGQVTTEYVLLIALLVVPFAIAINKWRNSLANFCLAICNAMIGPGV